MSDEPIIEPLDPADAGTSRNTTPLSRFCLKAVASFASSGLAAAVVRGGSWDARTLYKGMWRTCARKDYIKLVDARYRDGEVILVRRNA